MQRVGDQFRRDRDARLIFAVLTRISKKSNDGGDPVRACASRRVHHDEQLHQMLISRRTGRLNNENIVSPNVFLDPDVSLAIWKRADRRLTERNADVLANPLGQLAVGRAAENLQFWLKRKHRAANLVVSKWAWQSSKLASSHFFPELHPPESD